MASMCRVPLIRFLGSAPRRRRKLNPHGVPFVAPPQCRAPLQFACNLGAAEGRPPDVAGKIPHQKIRISDFRIEGIPPAEGAAWRTGAPPCAPTSKCTTNNHARSAPKTCICAGGEHKPRAPRASGTARLSAANPEPKRPAATARARPRRERAGKGGGDKQSCA